MKLLRIIFVAIIVFSISGTKATCQNQPDKCGMIRLNMTHAKSGGASLNIEILKRTDRTLMRVQDDLYSIDTTLYIDVNYFDEFLNDIRKIRNSDIENAMRVIGADGQTFTVGYGNYQNMISYKVWSPFLYSGRERALTDFNKAIKSILKSTIILNYVETEEE